MPIDNQKTPEQIDEELKKLDAIDEKELEEKEEEEEREEEAEETEEETEDKEEEETEETDDKETDKTEEEDEEDTETEEKKTEDKEHKEKNIDYKKRFADSQREENILYQQNQEILSSFDEADKLPEPTEAELKAEFPEWDLMSETEKKLAKKSLIADRKLQVVSKVAEKKRRVDEWSSKISDYVADEKVLAAYPKLAGKEEDFKRFAMKPTRIGFPSMDDLTKLFFYETRDQKPLRKSLPIVTAKGGGKDERKGTLTSVDVKKLRESNPKKYNEMVRAGTIPDQFAQ